MPQNSSVCKLLWNEFWSCNSAVVPSPQKTLWNHSLPKKGHKQEAVKREHTDWHLNRHTLKCKIVYNRLRELTQRWDSRNLLQRCMHLSEYTHTSIPPTQKPLTLSIVAVLNGNRGDQVTSSRWRWGGEGHCEESRDHSQSLSHGRWGKAEHNDEMIVHSYLAIKHVWKELPRIRDYRK